MSEFYQEPERQKQFKNKLEIDLNFPKVKHQSEISSIRNSLRTKQNSIKINRSKLPPDFFPRSQSLNRRNPQGKKTVRNDQVYERQISRKVESERMHISPQKTSFFGFFEESSNSSNIAHTSNLKRLFDSRQDPKREKLIFENRNFTPISGIQRGQNHLDMREKDESVLPNNAGKMSPRKQRLLKYKQSQQKGGELNQYELKENVESPKKINLFECQMSESQMHNITFFNAKSTSFPPINKSGNPN